MTVSVPSGTPDLTGPVPAKIRVSRAVEIPPSMFVALCHPRCGDVSEEVDQYFLDHWPFPDGKSRKKFRSAGFSRVTCLYFPKAKDDRIHLACHLLTILFLIDDLLEHMSLADGAAYNEHLVPLMRGVLSPDRSIPVEYMMHDLWESMRAHDPDMATEVLEQTLVFMRAQTDKVRTQKMGLGEYLKYRERDVGKGLLAALMRFSMGLKLSPEDLQLASPVDMNCAKHLSVINDIWSFDKELLASQTAHAEGGVLCSSVSTFADEAEVSIPATKKILYALCREWEARHAELVKDVLVQRDTPEMMAYLRGLEYQMSGNELWRRTTRRYSEPSGEVAAAASDSGLLGGVLSWAYLAAVSVKDVLLNYLVVG